jgi:hypothetical protein
MTGKTGLAREIEEVERRWHSLRQFSLLHDLTSVIRIGDVTVLTPDGPRLAEIKVNPANRRAGQTRRAERAIAILSGGAPIVTDAEELDLLASATQFSTHLPSVGKAIEAADREGIAWVRIARQLVVAAVSLEAGARLGFEDCQAAATLRKERAFQKAEMHTTAHHLQGDRMDTHTRDRGLAPYTIYPFPPEVCARLTADYLVLKSVIGWDRIADAFRDLGYEASCPFEGCDGQMTLDTPVVNLAKGDRTMTLHAWGLQQVQFEFLTTERFASGVDEMWNCDLGSSDRRSGVLTFGNEKGTWR